MIPAEQQVQSLLFHPPRPQGAQHQLPADGVVVCGFNAHAMGRAATSFVTYQRRLCSRGVGEDGVRPRDSRNKHRTRRGVVAYQIHSQHKGRWRRVCERLSRAQHTSCPDVSHTPTNEKVRRQVGHMAAQIAAAAAPSIRRLSRGCRSWDRCQRKTQHITLRVPSRRAPPRTPERHGSRVARDAGSRQNLRTGALPTHADVYAVCKPRHGCRCRVYKKHVQDNLRTGKHKRGVAGVFAEFGLATAAAVAVLPPRRFFLRVSRVDDWPK